MLRRSGLVGECSYFVGNVLVQVRHVFLPFYPSVLSLLKPRGVGIFWNKKKKKYGSNKESPLNSNVYIYIYIVFFVLYLEN